MFGLSVNLMRFIIYYKVTKLNPNRTGHVSTHKFGRMPSKVHHTKRYTRYVFCTSKLSVKPLDPIFSLVNFHAPSAKRNIAKSNCFKPQILCERKKSLCKCFFKFLTRDSFGDNFLVTNMWEVRFISKFYGNLDILFLGRFNESE